MTQWSQAQKVVIRIFDTATNQYKDWDWVLSTWDIEIGAVELKDPITDVRANIISDGVKNALIVKQNSQPLPIGAATENTLLDILATLGGSNTNTQFNEYNEDLAVVDSLETDIVTYTVPALATAQIFGLSATGSADWFFKLKINGTTVYSGRTQWTQRNLQQLYNNGEITASAGDVIKITVKHLELLNQSFYASLFGVLH